MSSLVVLLAALYMLEKTPRYEDGLVDVSTTQVVMITKCPPVFSYVADLTNYPQVTEFCLFIQ